MDLSQATNTPEEVELGGEAHRVRLLTMREWGPISAYIKQHCPSPVTRAAIALQEAKAAGTPIDVDIEGRMLDRADQAALAWPPKFGSNAWFDALGSIEGAEARLLLEILSRTDPTFTAEKAEALAPKVEKDQWADLMRVALYGTHPRPKGEATPEAAPP